jgi:hypothetical protein
MLGRFGTCASVLRVWILIGLFFGLIPVANGHDLPLDVGLAPPTSTATGRRGLRGRSG